ncbi:MAG TPA: hypothetical protein DCL43_04175 [Chitinophagaceae bacterium]|nr:hypothetical protein [Chitinophagaceae bacterium]HAN40140.1 hypothetical protein [Chitinophagaceae bacterium]
MQQLSNTWFTDGYIDYELKKYTLLAYLQAIHKQFEAQRLYPQLSDLIFHYNNLLAFKHNKQHLQEHFPKKLNGIQIQQLELLYEQLIADDGLMQELEAIIQFASKHMQRAIENGGEIYDFVERNLNIQTVGVEPLCKEEGYFLLSDGTKQTHAYQYRLSIFEKHHQAYRSMRTNFVGTWQYSISTSYTSIKHSLIQRNQQLPNPAVYAVETNLCYPIEETLLPVAKRSLVRLLSTA